MNHNIRAMNTPKAFFGLNSCCAKSLRLCSVCVPTAPFRVFNIQIISVVRHRELRVHHIGK